MWKLAKKHPYISGVIGIILLFLFFYAIEHMFSAIGRAIVYYHQEDESEPTRTEHAISVVRGTFGGGFIMGFVLGGLGVYVYWRQKLLSTYDRIEEPGLRERFASLVDVYLLRDRTVWVVVAVLLAFMAYMLLMFFGVLPETND